MSDAPDPQRLLRRADSVLETEIDGEIVLMSMDRGTCYGLDRIGSDIWRTLQTPITLAQLQDECSQRYSGDPGTIRTDVSRLLSELVSEQLVEPVP